MTDRGPGDGPNLQQALWALRRRWRVLGVCALGGAALGGVYVRRAVPEYEAEATIRITDTRAVLAGSLAAEASERTTGTDPILSRLQVLKSHQVADRAATIDGGALRVRRSGVEPDAVTDVAVGPGIESATVALRFDSVAVVASTGGRSITAPYGAVVDVGGVRFVVPRRPSAPSATLAVLPAGAVAGAVRGGIRAVPRENTDVVDVRFKASTPEEAQHTVNAAVAAYQQVLLERARAQLQRRVAFIGEQLRRSDSLLIDARAALTAFRSRQRSYATREDFAAVRSDLRVNDAQRGQLVAERQVIGSLLAEYDRSAPQDKGAALRALVGAAEVGAADPVATRLYQQVVGLETARDSLTQGPLPRALTHPEVARLDALIASTRARIVSGMRARMNGIDARIQLLEGTVARTDSALGTMPRLEDRESQLLERVTRWSRTSDEFRGEYQRALIAEAAEGGAVEIVDLAALPGQPVGLAPTRIIAFGGALGLVLGIGCVLLVEQLNSSVRRREDIERALNVPELALIPRSGDGSVGSGPRWLPLSGQRAARMLPARTALLVDVQSTTAEAYRMLRTNVLYAVDGAPRRRIAVTSPLPRDGKTTVSCNLAVALASPQRRVLLVDGDTRQPVVHRVFGVARGPGLLDRLAGRQSLDRLIQPTGVPGLDILPAGVLTGAPPDLAHGGALAELLDEAAALYPVVVVDTPPVLLTADAAVLAAHCDGVVVVLRAGQTAVEAGQQALHQLAAVNARVLGAVMNDPDNKARRGGYEAYYDTRYAASGAAAEREGWGASAEAADAWRGDASAAIDAALAAPAGQPALAAAVGRSAGGVRTTRLGEVGRFAPPDPSALAAGRARAPHRELPTPETVLFLAGRLEVVAGPDSGREFRFAGLLGEQQVEVTFGRNEGPADRHVQLHANTVSRQHAVMTHADGRWRLRNLSTTNPVVFNGRMLAPGEITPELSQGDRIEMGEVVFQFHER